MTKLWDISAPIAPGSPVFPGDTPYTQTWSATLSPGCPVNVASLTLSPHVGTHADAPLHYDAEGATAGTLALDPYLGPCRVVHVRGTASRVTLDEVADALTDPLPPRLLVRTYATAPVDRWDPDFRALDPALIEHLADRGVVLVGIDTASIDPADCKTLQSHQVIRRRGLRVLENLVLDAVAPGDYELIALPLKLMAADASPVRAVLRPLR